LLVVGMHRSGTSAVTGALGSLGLRTPDPQDLVEWPESNAEHWESWSLTRCDDRLLEQFGGSWEAPPSFAPGWPGSPTREHVADMVDAASTAFPTPGAVVWKDPRLCLLLPYWQQVLPSTLAVVFVWRRPLAVARSLRKRDGMQLADGIALWERYNKAALTNLVGLDTYVCSYEGLLADPLAGVSAMATWLGGVPAFADVPLASNEAAAATLTRSEGPSQADDDDLLLAEHRELTEKLSVLEGGHVPLGPTALHGESGWTTALLSAHRGSRTREFQIELSEKQREIDELRRSTSWRVTRPVRSVMSMFDELRQQVSSRRSAGGPPTAVG
jgi:hypothetical protein